MPLTPVEDKNKIDSEGTNSSDVLSIYATGEFVEILEKLTKEMSKGIKINCSYEN